MAQALLLIRSILRHIAVELSWRIPQGWKYGDSAVALVARVSASFHSCGLRLSPYRAMATSRMMAFPLGTLQHHSGLFIFVESLTALVCWMGPKAADSWHQREHVPLNKYKVSRDS